MASWGILAGMDSCCTEEARKEQKHVFQVVLAVNAAMFCVEGGAGILAQSTALLADSLDMLGDTLVYGFSLYVLNKSRVWRGRAAFLKGLVMLAFGLGVLLEAGLKLRAGVVPIASVMGWIGALALAANAFCFALLWRHRAGDLNLRSTWLCSRNDVVANGAVLVAAALVSQLRSVWPDVLVGVGIAGLFLWTALWVLHEAATELRHEFVDVASKG